MLAVVEDKVKVAGKVRRQQGVVRGEKEEQESWVEAVQKNQKKKIDCEKEWINPLKLGVNLTQKTDLAREFENTN